MIRSIEKHLERYGSCAKWVLSTSVELGSRISFQITYDVNDESERPRVGGKCPYVKLRLKCLCLLDALQPFSDWSDKQIFAYVKCETSKGGT